jgi:hypothetical protein
LKTVDEPYNGSRTSSTIDCNKSSSMAILHQQQKCYQEYHREPFSVHCFSFVEKPLVSYSVKRF